MSIAEKFEVIADEVYEKGKEYIWEVVQQGGTRTDYQSAFVQWDVDYIRPKYKVVPTYRFSCNQTFNSSKIKKVEAEYFDFSQKEYYESSTAGCYYMFGGCSYLEEIEDIKVPIVPNYTYAFGWCGKLHTIGFPLRCTETTTWSGAFEGCNSLQNVTIDGVIGKSINFKSSTKLSTKSIINIFESLSTTVTGQTLTLHSTSVNNMEFPFTSVRIDADDNEYTTTYNSWVDLAGDGIKGSPNEKGIRPNWTISLV